MSVTIHHRRQDPSFVSRLDRCSFGIFGILFFFSFFFFLFFFLMFFWDALQWNGNAGMQLFHPNFIHYRPPISIRIDRIFGLIHSIFSIVSFHFCRRYYSNMQISNPHLNIFRANCHFEWATVALKFPIEKRNFESIFFVLFFFCPKNIKYDPPPRKRPGGGGGGMGLQYKKKNPQWTAI